MYEDRWGLKEAPFRNTPEPRFFFPARQHEEALSRLLYVVEDQRSAGMLYGAFGCGKTFIAHALAERLDRSRYSIGMIHNPRLPPLELLRLICFSLGHSAAPGGKAEVQFLLQKTLEDNHRAGRRTVVIVDEAHAIESPDSLEELRLVLNYASGSELLATLLLMGHPELADRVRNNKALDQRIGMRYELGPLQAAETPLYVRHRLAVAGGSGEVFTPEALALVHDRSGGIPRVINQICGTSLLVGVGMGRKVVDAEVVQEACRTAEGG